MELAETEKVTAFQLSSLLRCKLTTLLGGSALAEPWLCLSLAATEVVVGVSHVLVTDIKKWCLQESRGVMVQGRDLSCSLGQYEGPLLIPLYPPHLGVECLGHLPLVFL